MDEWTNLDRIDREILTLLANDARLTNKRLATTVGLSQSACLERVRRLESRGALLGFHAEVAPGALGVGVQAVVSIQLKRHSRAAVARVEKQVLDMDEVTSIVHLTGATDFLVHIGARDMEHLRDFTLDAITSLPDVSRIETSIVFRALRKPSRPSLSAP